MQKFLNVIKFNILFIRNINLIFKISFDIFLFVSFHLRNEILEKQKLLSKSKFESSEKLAKVLQRANNSMDEISRADLQLEQELHKLAIMKNYKSKISQGQINLIVC